MRLDKCTKVLLFAIVVLLTIVLIRPVFEPKNTYANKKAVYTVGRLPVGLEEGREMENTLNIFAKEGWELVLIYNPGFGVFKR